MHDIISLCKGVKNLHLSSQSTAFKCNMVPLLDAVDRLPLKVLSLEFRISISATIMSTFNVFATLTHLETDDLHMFLSFDIECLPRLTHLALWIAGLIPGSKVVKLTNYILTHPTLQVLLFHIKSHRSFSYYLKEGNIIDPRIVIAPMDFCKWDDLGRGHMLLWELAEAKVKLRDPNHSQLPSNVLTHRDILNNLNRTHQKNHHYQ